jgi:AraC family transcriptional activator of pobA
MRQVSEYAALIDISPKHLSETVKEKLNTNALSFIHQRLLKEAQYLLVYTNKSIYQIAIKLRFNDSSEFSKFFKKQTGVNPKRYRILNKKIS